MVWRPGGDIALSEQDLETALDGLDVPRVEFAALEQLEVLPADGRDRVGIRLRPAAHDPQTYLLVFRQNVRGLTVGAPMEFRGIRIGQVTNIQPQFDEKTFEFSVAVTVQVDPTRFGVQLVDGAVPTNLVAARSTLRRTSRE